MVFFTFVSDKLPYHLSGSVRGDCTSQTDVSLLAQVSALPPTFFKWQAHQRAFLQGCWWVVISPFLWEWVADIGAVGSIFSLDWCLSLRLWTIPAAPQRSAGNSTLASYCFMILKVKIFLRAAGDLHILLAKRVTLTTSHIRIICTLVC